MMSLSEIILKSILQLPTKKRAAPRSTPRTPRGSTNARSKRTGYPTPTKIEPSISDRKTSFAVPNAQIFDRFDPEHFWANVEQYRAKLEGRAADHEFMYIPKTKRSSGAILTPRCVTKGHRITIALWI